MVSFFGLKLGSDRKKTQSKQPQSKGPQKWNRIDQNAPGEAQYSGNDLSRPQFPSSTTRPSTANSTPSMSSNWRAVFKNPAMTSSLVDLTPPPRRLSGGSLRHAASDLNLRPGTALPASLGGSGLRPGTPGRPSGAKRAGWVNPLDVHFCKNPQSTRPGTPLDLNPVFIASATPGSANNPMGQFDFRQHTDGHESGNKTNTGAPSVTAHNRKPNEEEFTTPTMYPTPPPSDTNSEGELSPMTVPAGKHSPTDKRNAPSALPSVHVPESTSLPGPMPMPLIQRASIERLEGTNVRKLPARRDTFAFHQPRRRSLTRKSQESYRATMMHPPKEGFSGNFADFDFGESVARIASNASGTNGKSSLDTAARPSMSSNVAKESDCGPASTPSSAIRSLSMKQTGREELGGRTTTYALEYQTADSASTDQLPRPPREHALRILGPPPAAAGAHRAHNNGTGMGFRQGFKGRFDSEKWSRATPPRPLQSVPPPSAIVDAEKAATRSPYRLPPDSGIGYTRSEPAPRPTEQLPSSPYSRPPMEGNFPVSKGLPRGRQPGPPPPLLQWPSSEDDNALPFPIWSDLDASEPRRSAMPAPLTPIRPSPSQGPRSGLSTPTSATDPYIPSPTFPSLAKSISNSSYTLGESLDMSFDDHANSPTLGRYPPVDRLPSTGVGISSRRVEAIKAPPRPAPVTLPPSPYTIAGLRSPVLREFPATFI